jgi:D-alanyl-D-alanine carboxypeptidase
VPLLKIGIQSPLAKRWNQFLRDHGWRAGTDDVFDFESSAGSKDFQIHWNDNHPKNKIAADGVIGNQSLGRAISGWLDDDLNAEAVARIEGGIYPAVQIGLKPIVGKSALDVAFGEIKFKRKEDGSDDIVFLNDWPNVYLSTAQVPQLKNITVPIASGKATVHKAVAKQFQALWATWESKQLLGRIQSYAGSYNPRVIRGTQNSLSLHAYAVAFDINVDSNGLGALPALQGEGGSVLELVGIANRFGFYWGGHFQSRFDGMHFEVCKILNAKELKAALAM